MRHTKNLSLCDGVYQDLALINDRTVAQNMLLGREPI